MTDIYARMQIRNYEKSSEVVGFDPGVCKYDHFPGSLSDHNSWKDYQDYLFLHSKLDETKDLIALDFACGPGRNIVLFTDRFKKIDGVDLAPGILANAKIYTSILPEEKKPNLYLCNGLDLSVIPDSSYDVVFSTIALQHICCHTIRYNYMKEFNRVLKPGGFLCVQMGFGRYRDECSVNYHENAFNTTATNGFCDTRVEDPKDVEKDLMETGFQDFEYNIRPVGPGDGHPNWIFWSAVKVSS